MKLELGYRICSVQNNEVATPLKFNLTPYFRPYFASGKFSATSMICKVMVYPVWSVRNIDFYINKCHFKESSLWGIPASNHRTKVRRLLWKLWLNQFKSNVEILSVLTLPRIMCGLKKVLMCQRLVQCPFLNTQVLTKAKRKGSFQPRISLRV